MALNNSMCRFLKNGRMHGKWFCGGSSGLKKCWLVGKNWMLGLCGSRIGPTRAAALQAALQTVGHGMQQEAITPGTNQGEINIVVDENPNPNDGTNRDNLVGEVPRKCWLFGVVKHICGGGNRDNRTDDIIDDRTDGRTDGNGIPTGNCWFCGYEFMCGCLFKMRRVVRETDEDAPENDKLMNAYGLTIEDKDALINELPRLVEELKYAATIVNYVGTAYGVVKGIVITGIMMRSGSHFCTHTSYPRALNGFVDGLGGILLLSNMWVYCDLLCWVVLIQRLKKRSYPDQVRAFMTSWREWLIEKCLLTKCGWLSVYKGAMFMGAISLVVGIIVFTAGFLEAYFHSLCDPI